MKRDMDLVRSILLRMEDSIVPCIGHKDGFDAYSQDTVNHHLSIMLDGGLITQTVATRSSDDDDCSSELACFKLTWEGHEFLDAVRGDPWWQNVKDKTKELTGGLALRMLKEVASTLGKRALE